MVEKGYKIKGENSGKNRKIGKTEPNSSPVSTLDPRSEQKIAKKKQR
jgi:hypothetical protein